MLLLSFRPVYKKKRVNKAVLQYVRSKLLDVFVRDLEFLLIEAYCGHKGTLSCKARDRTRYTRQIKNKCLLEKRQLPVEANYRPHRKKQFIADCETGHEYLMVCLQGSREQVAF